MIKIPDNFVTDRRGRKLGIVLNMRTYRRLMADIEELNEIRAYDKAKAAGGAKVSFEEAVRQIESGKMK